MELCGKLTTDAGAVSGGPFRRKTCLLSLIRFQVQTNYAGLLQAVRPWKVFAVLTEVSVESRKKQEEDDPDAWVSLSTALSYAGNGAVAGLLSKLEVYPLDTVKKRMQMHRVPRCQTFGVLSVYSSNWGCFVDVLNYEGAGFTKAQFPVY
ncbi:hypothetical protein PRIC2_014278 [Phytophthora ramorum]